MSTPITDKELNATLHWVMMDQLLDEMGAPKQVGRGTLSPFGRLQRLRIKIEAERAENAALRAALEEIGRTANTAYKYSNETRCTAHCLSIMEQARAALGKEKAT